MQSPKSKQENVEVLIKRSASVLSLSSGDSSTQPGCRGGNGGRQGEPPDLTQRWSAPLSFSLSIWWAAITQVPLLHTLCCDSHTRDSGWLFMITEPQTCIIWLRSQYYGAQSARCSVRDYLCVCRSCCGCTYVCPCSICWFVFFKTSGIFVKAVFERFLPAVKQWYTLSNHWSMRWGWTQVDRGMLCCIHTVPGRSAEMSSLATRV